MELLGRKLVWGVVSVISLLLAACGGANGGTGGGGGGNQNPTTPTVTVTPTTNSTTTAQALQVTITVAGTAGAATPTGSVTLSSGTYSSAATILHSGSASISIPAGALTTGSKTLSAAYVPDAGSSSVYAGASGTAMVSVTVATPTVTVAPQSLSIGTGQSLSVTVTVAGPSGAATPTGSVTLTSGTYSSGAKTLVNGSVTIVVAGGTFAQGGATLTASYSPDEAGAAIYASGSGSATVTITAQAALTVTVSPALTSLSTAQSDSVTITVKGPTGGATPAGSVVLSSGSYASTATTLTSGSASITVPAYSLVFGTYPLSATYTPDETSSGLYNSASGSATVSVARATPTITVTPAKTSISPLDSLNVTIGVGGSGAPAGTGTVTLSGGGYTSPAPVTISGATVVITLATGALASGSNTLTASYTPDTASSAWYKAGTGTSAAITVSSLVSVVQGTSIGTVTDQLLGMNLANWYDVVGNASDINAAFGKAGIKAIRWPGGSWSDTWHWRTSATNLLPSKCNEPGPGIGWGGYSPFSDFITSIAKGGNYDLALTANYGSNATCNGGGDPTEAAGWVAEAVSEGYAPSHVTVGNENYGTWEFDLHATKWDPTTYANSVTGSGGFYKLITAASPTTKVGVVVDGGGTQPGWDNTVLSMAKGSYDFVEYHYYPQYGDVTSDTYLVHQAALDFTTNINKVKSELATAGNTGTPIYVGELGSNSSNPGTQSWSITQGLYAGQLLGEAMNDGIARLTWWIGFGNCHGAGNNSPLLYGWQDWGAFNVFSDGPSDSNCPGAGPIRTMSPTAQAFNLFQNIAVNGESALSTTVNGDMTNIRAYSATHVGGTALFLFNLNQNQSQPVTVKLSGQQASSGVTVITYDKAIYDKTNAATPVWADPTTNDMGAQSLPLTLTLTPWSMNVVIIQ